MDHDSFWQIVAGVVGLLGVFGSVSIWLLGRGGKEAAYVAQAQNAEKLAVTATANCNLLLERIHDGEVHNATLFARLETIAQNANASAIASESRMSKSIDELKITIRDLIMRFENVMGDFRDRDRDRDRDHDHDRENDRNVR